MLLSVLLFFFPKVQLCRMPLCSPSDGLGDVSAPTVCGLSLWWRKCAPQDFQPVSCLPVSWNIPTSKVSQFFYYRLDTVGLWCNFKQTKKPHQGPNQNLARFLLVEIKIEISPGENQNCDLCQKAVISSCQYRSQFWLLIVLVITETIYWTRPLRPCQLKDRQWRQCRDTNNPTWSMYMLSITHHTKSDTLSLCFSLYLHQFQLVRF